MNNVLVGVVLLIISIVFVKCEYNTFKSYPTVVKTFENDTIMLPCYHNPPYKSIRWFRGESLLADSTRPDLTPPDRIKMWGNGSLEVSNLEASDTGEYSCHIQSELLSAKQVHGIEVQYPPSVIPSPASGVLEVALNSPVEMLCKAAGVPPPIITWKTKGKELELLTSRPRLQFKATSTDLEGEYECIANNNVGEPASAKIQLKVLSYPAITSPTPRVHTRVGNRAQLECIVKARPSANIHWFRSGQPIITTSGGRIMKMDGEMDSSKYPEDVTPAETIKRSVLIIRHVGDGDLGTYECRAENKIGIRTLNLELTGVAWPTVFKTTTLPTLPENASPPSLDPTTTHFDVSSTSHTLIWQTESLSPIIEYKLHFRAIHTGDIVDPGQRLKIDWNTLTIPGDLSDGTMHTTGYLLKGLVPATLYEATVTSRNRYGWSTASEVLRFTTGGEATDIYTDMTETEESVDDNTITVTTHHRVPQYVISVSNSAILMPLYLGIFLTLVITLL